MVMKVTNLKKLVFFVIYKYIFPPFIFKNKFTIYTKIVTTQPEYMDKYFPELPYAGGKIFINHGKIQHNVNSSNLSEDFTSIYRQNVQIGIKTPTSMPE